MVKAYEVNNSECDCVIFRLLQNQKYPACKLRFAKLLMELQFTGM